MTGRLLVGSLLVFFTVSFAADDTSLYDKANTFYQHQDYSNAIQSYEQLLKGGKVAPEVYYNLANSYYKSGNIAKAILNYERTLKLNPNDEDAEFNLHVAQLKVVDKMEPVPQIFYKRWISSIAEAFTPNTWSKLVLILFWITFGISIFYLLSRIPAVRQVAFIFILFFLFLTAFSFFFAHQSYTNNEVNKKAVVMFASAYVKSSPDDKGNDLFIVHEGTKVEVLDDFLSWKKVRIANGSIGWLKTSEIEQI